MKMYNLTPDDMIVYLRISSDCGWGIPSTIKSIAKLSRMSVNRVRIACKHLKEQDLIELKYYVIRPERTSYEYEEYDIDYCKNAGWRWTTKEIKYKHKEWW